jgi:hypothetical protein
MVTIPAVPQNQPLPRNPFRPQDAQDLHDAYDQCLASESEAGSEQELAYARCLGYFLTELPTARGKHMVAEDIVLCQGDKEAMDRLAQLYIKHVIRLCESTFANSIYITFNDVRVQSDRTKDKPPPPRITLVDHPSMITVLSSLPRSSQRPKITEPQNVQ